MTAKFRDSILTVQYCHSLMSDRWFLRENTSRNRRYADDQERLWSKDSGAGSRVDPSRTGDRLRRTDAPLLAAGLSFRRISRIAEAGKNSWRRSHRLSRSSRSRRLAVFPLQPSRCLARIWPGRSTRLAMLLSRLALRCRRQRGRDAAGAE